MIRQQRRKKSIISLFIFHFQFIPLIYSFSFFFSFFLLFSCLISQANTTQNSKRESFPPFSISLTFSLFNFIDLRQTTYFYNNSLPSAKESKILLNKTSNLCTNSFNYVIQLRACSTVLPSEVFKYLYLSAMKNSKSLAFLLDFSSGNLLINSLY